MNSYILTKVAGRGMNITHSTSSTLDDAINETIEFANNSHGFICVDIFESQKNEKPIGGRFCEGRRIEKYGVCV